MSVINKISVTRKIGSYFEGKIPDSPTSLLKAVRRAIDDIKKEEPGVTGLNIANISFICDSRGDIILKVDFE